MVYAPQFDAVSATLSRRSRSECGQRLSGRGKDTRTDREELSTGDGYPTTSHTTARRLSRDRDAIARCESPPPARRGAQKNVHWRHSDAGALATPHHGGSRGA